jgi:hypothetical protein
MKNLVLLLLSLTLFTSCNRVVYTHQEYLGRIQTKNDAIYTFGAPSNKSFEGELEIWTYNLGSGTVQSNYANGNATYSGYGANVGVNSLSETSNYSRQLTFIFLGNNVKSWNSRGVDYTKYELDKKRTYLALAYYWVGLAAIFLVVSGGLR